MAHTIRQKTRLLHRVRRVRGQLNAVERALEKEHDCGDILLTLAACRGGLDALMAEIMEGHVYEHILDPAHKPTREQTKAAKEIVGVVRRYLR